MYIHNAGGIQGIDPIHRYNKLNTLFSLPRQPDFHSKPLANLSAWPAAEGGGMAAQRISHNNRLLTT